MFDDATGKKAFTIWKYQLRDADRFEIDMPFGAIIVSVQAQRDIGVLWAIVDPSAERVTRKFRTVGTGWTISTTIWTHRGTFQKAIGLVWHLLEELYDEVADAGAKETERWMSLSLG